VESRNVTYVSDDWPIFWEEARGSNVVDADGNVYIDLTSAFGVALLGHCSGPVRYALNEQVRLIHGMGDVHPPTRKLELLERLASLSPWPDARSILATSGSEAVEAALKTAALASGRPGIIAFEGGYHGLTLGSLSATERGHFRVPFEARTYGGVAFAPFPDPLRDDASDGMGSLRAVRSFLETGAPNGDAIGTIIVEPVQGRGGARIPPIGYMKALTELAREFGVIVIADEILTGMGRCGAPFASGLVGLQPDLLCVGKALGGGLPISACIGPQLIMDAWPASTGEAIHTSTFLGHPLACAVAISVLDAMEIEAVPGQSSRLGDKLLHALDARLSGLPGVLDVRGLGLLLGVEFVGQDGQTPASGMGARVAERALGAGLIVLPAGDHGHVLELTPPVVLSDEQVDYAVDALGSIIEDMS
jgi:4-aminobutyrate aminotransferase/(S)-3-amino-2-methylpropionate transaminase